MGTRHLFVLELLLSWGASITLSTLSTATLVSWSTWFTTDTPPNGGSGQQQSVFAVQLINFVSAWVYVLVAPFVMPLSRRLGRGPLFGCLHLLVLVGAVWQMFAAESYAAWLAATVLVSVPVPFFAAHTLAIGDQYISKQYRSSWLASVTAWGVVVHGVAYVCFLAWLQTPEQTLWWSGTVCAITLAVQGLSLLVVYLPYLWLEGTKTNGHNDAHSPIVLLQQADSTTERPTTAAVFESNEAHRFGCGSKVTLLGGLVMLGIAYVLWQAVANVIFAIAQPLMVERGMTVAMQALSEILGIVVPIVMCGVCGILVDTRPRTMVPALAILSVILTVAEGTTVGWVPFEALGTLIGLVVVNVASTVQPVLLLPFLVSRGEPMWTRFGITVSWLQNATQWWIMLVTAGFSAIFYVYPSTSLSAADVLGPVFVGLSGVALVQSLTAAACLLSASRTPDTSA